MVSGLFAITALTSAEAASSVAGPTAICAGTTNSYSLVTTFTESPLIWSIGTNNSAGGVILGDSNTTNVAVVALTNGSFDLECAVDLGDGYYEIASTNILVSALVSGTPLVSQTACPGGAATFSTTVTGAGYTVLWRKDGDVIPDALTESLALTNLAATNAGVYSIEVTGACNSFTNVATLELVPPPSLTGPTNFTVQCLVDVPAPDTNSIIATNATSVFHVSDAPLLAGCVTTITRTYGAVNSCGTTSTWAQIITVSDTTAPVLVAASNALIEAGTAWAFTAPSVSDNCAGTNLAVQIFSTVTNAFCGQTFAVTRTWTASDTCSNAGFASQTITILDSTPPVLAGMTNFVVEFGTNWNFLSPTAGDIADGTNVTLVITSTTTNATCGNTFTAERVWTATDSCSNSAMFTQLVSVVDTTPPAFTGQTNRIVEFGTPWDFEPPQATDIADGTNVTLVVASTTTNALCGLTFAATRTWTAIDACGNSASSSQTITIVDTAPPVFSGTNSLTFEFGATWDFISPEVSDVVDGTNVALVIISTTTNALCGNTFKALRTWAVTDSCSNAAIFMQTVTLIDTTLPTFAGITNQIVEFGSVWDFEPPQTSDIADGTNVALVVSSTTTNALCGNTFAAIRTWIATDSCSNSAAFTQTITVQDTTAPFFSGLTNRVVEFGVVWDFIAPEAGDLADGTNLLMTVTGGNTNAQCGNTYIATRTWQTTDSCSNTATFTQTVAVLDTTPPLLAGLTNRVVEFGTAWDFMPPLANDIADGTNVVLVVINNTTNATCGNTFTAERVWTATDSCSNSASFSQIVAVVDTTPPTFSGVTNRIIECGTAWTFDVPIVTDIADGTNLAPVITGTTTNALCGETFAATRFWSAMDSCSNSATFAQTITIVDTTPPLLICASNRVVECGDVWNFETPTVTDVCGGTNVTLTTLTTVTNPLVGQTFAATRSWLAVDACSNSITCAQTITILDRTPPDITCSSNIVVECAGGAGNPVSYIVTAFDGCDTNVVLVVTPPSGSLFSLGTNLVRAVATDDSGNSNVCTFNVIVRDTTPPNIACPPNLIVSEAPRDSGGAVVTFAAPTVLDTCDSTPTIFATPPSGSVFPVGTNTVTWTAVDGSGNSNSCTFTIRVIPYRLFVVSNTDDSGSGSLRQAILDSNDAPDDNLIIFSLAGTGPFTINLESPLPPITSAVTLDGWSQGGSNLPPIVQLRGASNAFDGIVIQSGRSIVRGLSFHGFATALVLEGGTNVVQGNYLGVDVTAINAPGNSDDGIRVLSSSNQIGGTVTGTGNLISGNGGNGITFTTAAARENSVQGNLIGTSVFSTNALPNAGHGVFFTNGAALNMIGGTEDSSANVIAFNGLAGVALAPSAGTGNAILGNSISGNSALGIDLGTAGITANDNNDSDAGPNTLQNFPILTDARSASGTTIIEGGLSSAADTGYRIEFFLNNTADPSGNGEGSRYLGAVGVETKGNGEGTFSFSLPLTAVYTQFVTATATDADGNTSEFSPAISVRTPPIIEAEPVSTNAVPGETVTFCASASGTPPIRYQWRLNGVNIWGATNSCFTIPSANVGDGGTYSVLIGNELDTFATTSASLLMGGANILNLPTGDNFADAVDISGYNSGTNGVLAGNNQFATLEPMEPMHAGKPGGKSVWYRWCTPAGNKGIATFRTTGSTFDTVMAVYRGASLTNLYESANDEDAGTYYSSEVRFNAFANTPLNSCYYIAVDGFGGAGGPFVLLWELEKTSHMLPVILTQPQSQTVAPDAPVTFTAFAVPECANGHLDCNPITHWEPNNWKKEKITYQWFFENTPIPDATNASYSLPSVTVTNVGDYFVRVFTPWQQLDSRKAVLQINADGGEAQNVQAVDKFIDALFAGALFVGPPQGQNAPAAPPMDGPQIASAPGAVVRGYTGSQIFNTAGSAAEPGEVICGVVGGSSEWLTVVAEQTGTLFLNTDGSSYDTVMAAFQRNPTNANALVLLNCDNNSGADGKDSSLVIPVQVGTTNFVLVDGVNGAVGTLYLNYSLATTTVLKVAGRSSGGANIIQINGRPGLNFRLQASADMKTWSTLITTSAPTGVLDYTDDSSIGVPRRYYRALILP